MTSPICTSSDPSTSASKEGSLVSIGVPAAGPMVLGVNCTVLNLTADGLGVSSKENVEVSETEVL